MEFEDTASEGTRGSEEHGLETGGRRILCRGRKLSCTQCVPPELGDLLQETAKQVCEGASWFLLTTEERYKLTKGLLNKRNQESRAARCLGSPDGEDVTARK